MKQNDEKPELFKVDDLNTYRQWYTLMEDFGHVWFHVDGMYYFLFPLGPHKYGLCLGEDETDGNPPRWTFDSEDAFLQSPMFGGKTILDRAADVMSWEPPFFPENRWEGFDV